MPSSAVRTFTDPEDYAEANGSSKSELTVSGRGHFTAKLVRIDLHRLSMQRFSDNLPRIAHSSNLGGLAINVPHPAWAKPSAEWCRNAADQHSAR